MPDYYLGHDGLWVAPYRIYMVGCGWRAGHVGLSGKKMLLLSVSQRCIKLIYISLHVTMEDFYASNGC